MVVEIPGAGQVPEELEIVLGYARGKKLILEIGTAGGGSLYQFMQVADQCATLVSIDMPDGMFGSGQPQPDIGVMLSWRRIGQTLYIIRDNSHAIATVNKVLNVLEKRKFDFAFIDGDHTYEGVKRDYDLYHGFCKLMAFHDIVNHPNIPEVGVDRFWKELEGDKTEIIHDPDQGWAGIGILKLEA